MDPAEIVFFFALQDGTLTAEIPRSRPSMARLTGNLGPHQEIGMYEVNLGPEAYEGLRTLKQRVDFEHIPPSEPVPPGTKSICIGETVDGQAFDMKGWPQYAIPPAVQPLLDEARRLSETILAKPLRVIRGSGAATGRTFEKGSPVAFRVSFKNIGAEPLRTSNPLSTTDSNFAGVRLVVSADKPSLAESDIAWIDLAPQDVHPEPQGAARTEHATLAAGEELSFTVKKALRAGPGQYRAILIYYASPVEGEADRIEGTLRIDLGKFEIVPASEKGR
jgi:hypothetical protein